MSLNAGRRSFNITAPAYTPTVSGEYVLLSPKNKVKASELKGALFIAPNAGTATNFTITIAGTYIAGDTIRITISSNDTSRQKWNKSYFYEVQPSDTTNTIIATNIKNKIATDGASSECPYSATSSAGVITVTAKNNDKHALTAVKDVASTSGTCTLSTPSTTVSEGQTQDLIDRGVSSTDASVLSSWDTVRIDFEPEAAGGVGASESVMKNVNEIFWFGTPGQGVLLETLINSL